VNPGNTGFDDPAFHGSVASLRSKMVFEKMTATQLNVA